MEIRAVGDDDIPTLVDEFWTPFTRKMLADEPGELADGFREDALAYRAKQLEREDRIDRIAEAGGTPLGYVSAEVREAPPVIDRADSIHILELYVCPEHRREGVAAALLTEAEQWGDQQGCSRVTLNVHRVNEGAQALYREEGFEIARHEMRKDVE